MLELDDLIPAPDFRERHELHISAPPAAVWDALQDVRLGDLALSRTLMAIRAIPERLAGRGPSRITSGRFLESAPVPVLASEANQAVLAAGLLQPWKLHGAQAPPVLDAAGLRAVQEQEDFRLGKTDFGLADSQVRRYTALTRHLALTMAALAVCATTAALARPRTSTLACPPGPGSCGCRPKCPGLTGQR